MTVGDPGFRPHARGYVAEVPPRLLPVRVPDHPSAVVLVLHGGAARQHDMTVSPAQLSVLRMIPVARRIARAGRNRVAVFRLLNSARGWNTTHTPVHDAQWALDQVAERLGERLPTGLVGHSLGGRAALLAGSAAEVGSVVALAPWVYPDDDNPGLSGRRVLIVHGSADRIAKPATSLVVAATLRRHTDVGYIRIDGGKHAMLAHGGRFGSYAAQFVVSTLLGDPVTGPVADVLAGQDLVEV